MITSQHFIRKIQQASERAKSRSGPNLLWMEENADDSRLREPSFDFHDGIPSLTAHLNDFVRGLALITGWPNAGKSTFIVHNTLELLRRNPNAVVVDISHDDDLDKRYVQWISNLTGLTYMSITSGRDRLTETKRKAIEDAEAQICKWIEEERLYPFESTELIAIEALGGREREISLKDFETLFTELKRVRARHPDKKIVVFVDAWNDMRIYGNANDYSETNKWIGELKALCRSQNLAMVMSAHLKKTQGKVATLEDIAGSATIGYEAIWAMIMVNQARNPETFKNPIFIERNGVKMEVLAGECKKSKVGGWASFNLYWGIPLGVARLVPLFYDEYLTVDKEYRNVKR